MPKNYVILENGNQIGHSLDVDLDPKFLARKQAEGFEYKEVPDALNLEDPSDAIVDGQGNVVEDPAKKQLRKDRVQRDQTLRDIFSDPQMVAKLKRMLDREP